jgi:hypothetical protein
MVIAQEPTQPLATLHVPRAMAHDKPRKQQDVASALMISLGMVVLNIFAQCSPQGALAAKDETLAARLAGALGLLARPFGIIRLHWLAAVRLRVTGSTTSLFYRIHLHRKD